MADGSMHRTALITGGGTRIGLAVAEALAGDGWRVALHYHASATAARAAAAAINGGGGRAAALDADLAEPGAAESLVDRAATALDAPVVCLVNNAAVFDRDTVATATRESWDHHMDVNLRAPFVLTQRFARALPAGREGAVVNLLDQRVWNLTGEFVTYTLSKSALWTLTRTLALALAPRVRVNGIGPGPVLPSARQSDAHFAAQAAATPLGRPVDIADVVAAVRFLIATPSVTGQMIAVDSGQHLVTPAAVPE